jgi:putative membrane protein
VTDQDSSRRDDLALARTDLANERTLLAYGRTALMVAATGLTAVKFFPDTAGIFVIGWSLAAASVLISAVGIGRFVRLKHRLHP